jgi:indolepyruvate ferredoxin oxidoreductase alpha subunit
MKHVGVNVAADPFFSVAYTGVPGSLVILSADDPGMHSSQNEQDNRRFAVAAAMTMIEPSDAQESYDMMRFAVAFSEEWKTPVMLRLTTRVCHSKSLVKRASAAPSGPPAHYERDIRGRVMIPGHARPVHRLMRQRLAGIAAWNETSDLNREFPGEGRRGLIASGVAFMHAREAAPDTPILKLGMTYPLPFQRIRDFVRRFDECLVIEEGDPYMVESLRAEGIWVEGKAGMYRFGELNVSRVRRILEGDTTPETPPPPGKPPELCKGCPHRGVFLALASMNCIVAGDIGCYTLGALPPFEGMDTQLCMGASIGMGLGLRHLLPPEEARRVVSVIGDSTFMHSGLTGLAEMVYNPPPTGHVLVILDNGTTAMTGMQEHPGTGRTLNHKPTGKIVFEEVAAAMGVHDVRVVDSPVAFKSALADCLQRQDLSVIIVRRVCRLAEAKIEAYERAAELCNAE